MKQIITRSLLGIALLSTSAIASGQQNEQRLKSVKVQVYKSGNFVDYDSTHYNWGVGEGAGSTDFRQFEVSYWGWYFNEPIEKIFELPRMMSKDQVAYSMDASSNTFEEMLKSTLVLDANGQVSEKKSFIMEAGNWKQDTKLEYTYQNGKCTLFEAYKSPDGVNWENLSKQVMTYHANGKLETLIGYTGLINSQWLPDLKTAHTYNGSLLTERTTIQWDDVTDNWNTHPYQSWIYTYNNNDHCDTVTYRQWVAHASNLEPFQRSFYEYNANGFIVRFWNQQYDRNNSQFKHSYRRIYTYNYSYPLEAIGARWDEATSSFNDESRWEFTFNGELLTMIEAEIWDNVIGNWGPDPHSWFGRKTHFYYEDIDEETNIDIIEHSTSFLLYPNPAEDRITIKTEKNAINHVKITNISGQMVFQNQESLNVSEVTIPVDQLDPGIYFLHINSNHATTVKSFSVR